MKQINIKIKQNVGIGLLWLLTSLLFCHSISGQGKRIFYSLDEYDEFIRDSIINNSDYIFEGYVLRDTKEEPSIIGYYGDDKIKICTAVKIKISKIFRGHNDLELGTAELIQKGGEIFDYSSGTRNLIDNWDDPMFATGMKDSQMRLFFCKKNEFPVKKNIFKEKIDNKLRLSLFYDVKEWDFLYNNLDEKKTLWKGELFKNTNQIYRYLKKYDNIEIRKAQEKKFVDTKAYKKQQKLTKEVEQKINKLKYDAEVKRQKELEQFILDSIIAPQKSKKK
ncbi:hypothetical protein [Aquimarina agarivorans]|uniref:hypothetical protein n=1 Tax=Aquimarina agarivorans TaxID=980584 RepID=UPI000248EBEC|nr:hypothetical protein [Aquimarina agarivorans]